MFDRDPSITEEHVKIITTTAKGSRVARPVKLRYRDGRIQLLQLPFGLKDEIKACLTNPKWDMDGKYWSVADDLRSRFQLMSLTGGNPYENWEKPLIEHSFQRDLMAHQRLMVNHALTYHYKILAAEPGTGKSLTMIETIEKSDVDWWYVSSKSGCVAVELEFEKWGINRVPELMTYEGLLKRYKAWNPGDYVPPAIVFDEYSRCTNSHAQRAQSCRHFADQIRKQYGWNGYVIGASGSCSPKSPVGWWMLAEIIFPGFLRENNAKSFEWRLRIFEQKETSQGTFPVPVAWRDDERRCDICGLFEFEEDEDGKKVPTHFDAFGIPCKGHPHTPSKNEVAYLRDRLDGLVLTVFKKDCLDLPELEYREMVLPATPTIKRAAKALASSARTTIQALTWLRALSDGFQYETTQTETMIQCPVCKGSGEYKAWEAEDFEELEGCVQTSGVCDTCQGEGQVPKFVRESKYFKGPKQEALEGLLDSCEEHGRIIVSAGFTASIDRCVQICQNKGWDVIRIDGRGWKIMPYNPEHKPDRKTKAMQYWQKSPNKVAIVMHPESGGTGLTLTEAYMIVVYSNDFKPENRIQLVNRIHRPGMTRGAVIVDLLHLGTDRKVLDTLKANHKLEKLSLGDIAESV